MTYDSAIPFHSHASSVTVFNGLNFFEWREQVQFHLGVMDLDLAMVNDKPAAITDSSSTDEKSFHKVWERSNRLSLMFMRMNIANNIKSIIPQTECAREYLKFVENVFVLQISLSLIYLLKEKSQAAYALKVFVNEVERKLDKKVRIIRLDRGGEYYGKYNESRQCLGPYAKFLEEHGICAQYTMPGIPQQIGIAERRFLVRQFQRLLLNCGHEASGSVENQSVEIKEVRVNILLTTNVPTSIQIPNIVPVVEEHFDNTAQHLDETLHKETNLQISVTNEPQEMPLRKSQRVRNPAISDDYVVYLQESNFDIGLKKDPISFSQAIESNESDKWIDAMKEELKFIEYNKVWDLVELPKSSKRIGCRWVFKTKRDSNGNIERYKARLVSKGYTQKGGIDYKETFSPVSKKDSLRIIMTLVTHYNLELHQMDVKTAFLNENLEEEVYMDQLEGFETKGNGQVVCKLKKSIY
ncbi:uncharacterized protein LOC142165730 [Nicotiana tabacum]|uniref:Uncharacterized protein LOC142165730 n=1 Tax=Nicotiana tabacum TaxID=4097 RepID=A0AC58S5F6_TOBAC